MGLGILGSLFSLVTVFTTAMIYAQLKTVPRWNTPITAVLLLLLSLCGGALLAGQVGIALVLLPAAAAVQLLWWMQGDRALSESGTDLATATGLGSTGAQVRAFEPPHTGTNYLLKEFAYVVGRKHALKLRAFALGAGYALPFVCLWAPFSVALMAIIALIHTAGIVASRWLFFAEAEHVVGLYYGKR